METHYSSAVESAAAQQSPRDLLSSPVTVLVGVDEDAKAALAEIGVESVHDLATSPVFEIATAVYETASSGDPSGNADRSAAMAAASSSTDGDLAELVAAELHELEGVSESAADDLQDALGITVVRDLARWQPYAGARAILGALTGEDAETDRGVPEELVPVARKYGTEETFYTKVYVDERVAELDEYEGETEIGPLDREDLLEDLQEHGMTFDWTPQWDRIVDALDESGDWSAEAEIDTDAEEIATDEESESSTGFSGDVHTARAMSLMPSSRRGDLYHTATDRRVDVTTADPDVGGFRQPAVGGVIQFSQKWVPQGLSLGQLLHSTTLAPGESTKVAVVDWSRRTEGQRQESEAQQEETQAEMVQNRSISEVQNGVTSEVQSGRSMVSSTSSSKEAGGTRNYGLFGTGGSVSGGKSQSSTTTTTVSTSKGRREVHAEMSQKIRNSTQQHASSSRTRRATVVRETEQEESEEVRTRVVTNHNHMHALSVHYYEVVQIFRTEVGPEDAQPVLFVPFKPLDFTDTDLIFKHRQALKAAALDETTRQLVDGATGFVDLRTDFELGTGHPHLDLRSELRSLGAERTGTELSMPGDNELLEIEFDGPQSTITVHAEDGTTETVRSGGGTRYTLDEPIAFEDVDMVEAEITEEWETPDEGDLNRTLVIDGSGGEQGGTFLGMGGGPVEYDFEVAGDAEQVRGSLEGFSVSQQASDSVQGGSISGQVSTGRDGFRFSGEIEDWTVENTDGATVYVDGERWDPGEDPPEYQPTETVEIGLGVRRPDGTRGGVFGTLDVYPETDAFRLANVSGADELAELTARLQEEQLHYSQAVWRSLDPQTLTMVLAQFQIDGRSAAEFVDPTPEAVHGNYVAFPLAIPEAPDRATDETHAKLATWWDGWTEDNFDPEYVERDLVPLPSGGVHGESILGRANGAEKLDITRFWDWQESPIPQQSPQIAPIQTGSRASSQDLEPQGFDSPIVQMQQPQQLPDPTGIGAAMDVLGQSGIFRDMSGMEAAADVAQTTSKIAGKGSRHATDAAVETFKAGAQAQNQALSTVADTVTSLAGGGAFSASNAGNSSFGAALNEMKRQDGTASSTSGGVNSGNDGSPGSGATNGSTGGTGSSGSSDTGGPSSSGGSTGGAGSRSNGGDSDRSPVRNALRERMGMNDDGGSSTSAGTSGDASADDGASSPPPSEGGSSFHESVSGNVPIRAQPSGMTCWATVTTMLLSWRDGTAYSIDDAMDAIGSKWERKFHNNNGLLASEKQSFLNDAGLVAEPPATNYGVDQFRSMLESYGPLWVTGDVNPTTGTFAIHARILIEMWGDGTPSGTTLKLIDPAGGTTQTLSFQQFAAQFEEEISDPTGGSDTRIQVVHWPEQDD